MGVYIKGMAMPKNCDECYIRKKDTCPLIKTNVTGWGRPLNCPLVELPPHGRLIDADELMLIIRDYIEEYDGVDGNGYHDLKWCAMKETEMAINNAPTIIESEGEDG